MNARCPGSSKEADGAPDGEDREHWHPLRSRIPSRSSIPNRDDLAVGAFIGVLTWPIGSVAPKVGIDTSWIVGLHLAARLNLSFGRDIVFTSGPLGFLGWPEPYVAWTSAAALVFVALLHLTACISLVHLASQAMGLPRASLLVLLIAFTFPWLAGWTLLGILIFIAVVAAVLRRTERPTGAVFAVALGAVVGFAGLGKVNIAMVSLLVAAIGVATTARQTVRSLAWFGAAGATVFVVLWLGVGQHLSDLPVYVRSVVDLSAGYSESMGAVDPQESWTWGVAMLSSLILVGLFWRRSEELPRRDRWTLRLLIFVTILAEYKAGFTRAGVGVAIYCATLLALWAAVAPKTQSWLVGSTPVAGMLAAFLAVGGFSITTLVDPIARVSAFESQLGVAVFHRHEAATATAALLRAQYGLPGEAVSLMSGRTVHIEPWEAAIADAYPEFRWDPEPVFQAYAAFTPSLDKLNADRLAGPAAPDRILWITTASEPLSIDGRGFWFDAPRAKIEMLCRYVPLDAGPDWQVLGRVPNRCGAPTPAGQISAVAGEPIRTPTNLPPGIVTVRIVGVASDPLSRLEILIDRGAPWFVSDGQSTERIPLATSNEPNVIAATGDVGYVGRLALRRPPATLTVGPATGDTGTGTPLTLEFAVIPIVGQP